MSHAERGFSLIEMMVATAIMSLALSIAGAFFVASRNTVTDQMTAQETLQGLRAALDTLERDFRLGGACLPMSGADFPALAGTNSGTLDGVTTRTTLVKSDMTCIQASLVTAASAGNTTLSVNTVSGFAAGQRAYIRDGNTNSEYINITGVNAGTTPAKLTISSGLQLAYTTGSYVYAVDERVYKIDSTTYTPVTVLTIAVNGATPVPFAYGVQAVNVQYQLSSNCPPCDVVDLPTATQWPLVNQLFITVTMKSLKKLSNGQYYTATGAIGAKPRNLLPGSSVLGAPT